MALADVQAYTTLLERSELATSSQDRAITAIKSLFTFAHKKTGLLPANPAGPVTAPKIKDALSERILPQAVVQVMMHLEPDPRNRVLLKLLYIALLAGVRANSIGVALSAGT